MPPPLPRVRPTGPGSISDSEFQRYVDALGQMGPQFQQQQQQPQQQQLPMSSGSTSGMEQRAYQRYIDALSRLRAAEQQPMGQTGPLADPGAPGDFTSSLPPQFPEATAAQNEYEKMRHYNRVMGGGTSSDAEFRNSQKSMQPSMGPLGDFFRSMRDKLE
jgi:hypothetical protein